VISREASENRPEDVNSYKIIGNAFAAVRMLLRHNNRHNKSLIMTESEYGLIDPADRRSVSQIVRNAHLLINVHGDESIRPRDVFIMHKSAA
ncbi:MAG: hypothetical protein WD342_10915, partial [Verrucomicrobiales bacterium]